jgi:hypothetical protein
MILQRLRSGKHMRRLIFEIIITLCIGMIGAMLPVAFICALTDAGNSPFVQAAGPLLSLICVLGEAFLAGVMAVVCGGLRGFWWWKVFFACPLIYWIGMAAAAKPQFLEVNSAALFVCVITISSTASGTTGAAFIRMRLIATKTARRNSMGFPVG